MILIISVSFYLGHFYSYLKKRKSVDLKSFSLISCGGISMNVLSKTNSLFNTGILSKEHYLDQRLFGLILLSVKLSQEAFWTSTVCADPSD